ncbi:hypothetical protein PSTT_08230 [Puccinia striiformis]|uniref:Uncharacterized protein n=1 Tax=Puccinia striiformis TaxID=27350 RepID=A0A2S4VD46_9BASI|nr:hypothetical protein PSTT_08230 [Puccinia striiformis]
MDLRTRSRSFSYNATNLTVSPRRPRQLNRTQLSNSPVGLTILNASDGFTRTQLHAASKDVIGMTLSSNESFLLLSTVSYFQSCLGNLERYCSTASLEYHLQLHSSGCQ